MTVMFTSPAYSAVRSNNLQSRYPEGRCRLKMSNLFFLRHRCGDAALITQFQYDVIFQVSGTTKGVTDFLSRVICFKTLQMQTSDPDGCFVLDQTDSSDTCHISTSIGPGQPLLNLDLLIDVIISSPMQNRAEHSRAQGLAHHETSRLLNDLNLHSCIQASDAFVSLNSSTASSDRSSPLNKSQPFLRVRFMPKGYKRRHLIRPVDTSEPTDHNTTDQLGPRDSETTQRAAAC
ncbi:hypothetical protein D9C73_023894 [Collichthys lucidus]|uniref:Uncharacterized protein n=1 Tax=Collichthys lucidus TaxID=240159 RepID=A0A4U5VMV8_COLLU|nr:hypothetical protein D9C73_023894 [Collichthys lucidus]